MANPVPRVRVPATAKKGELLEVKTLISHEMESGQRKDAAGAVIPRKIIKQFEAKYNGKTVFAADWGSSVSSNPYQSFFPAGAGKRNPWTAPGRMTTAASTGRRPRSPWS